MGFLNGLSRNGLLFPLLLAAPEIRLTGAVARERAEAAQDVIPAAIAVWKPVVVGGADDIVELVRGESDCVLIIPLKKPFPRLFLG